MSSTTPTEINYAKFAGFNSLAAAILFSILYAALSGWFIFRFLRHKTRVDVTLILFSLIRCVAFALRAAMIKGKGATSLSMFVTVEVLFSAGFFAILMATLEAIILQMTVSRKHFEGLQRRVVQSGWLFRGVLLAAVALTIAGIVETSNNDSGGATLTKVATIIFLVASVWLVFSSVINFTSATSLGKSMAMLFVIISALILVREAYMTATMDNTSARTNEAYWYPLSEVPAILCIFLYAVVGLFRRRSSEENEEEAKELRVVV
ncbi:hypothetical protein DL96DRAFT_320129 [Flagelloscypha sp. PMI_526]|nr:hypothetical protein DL96DRAFT_320129 [Flagelloscypha sp. PMI_526]